MKDFGLIEMPNGIRVVHKEITNTKIAHVGIMLDIGSRDELPEEQGIAHFWEHMAFKGTQKRNSFHIINRLESRRWRVKRLHNQRKNLLLCFRSTRTPGTRRRTINRHCLLCHFFPKIKLIGRSWSS